MSTLSTSRLISLFSVIASLGLLAFIGVALYLAYQPPVDQVVPTQPTATPLPVLQLNQPGSQPASTNLRTDPFN